MTIQYVRRARLHSQCTYGDLREPYVNLREPTGSNFSLHRADGDSGAVGALSDRAIGGEGESAFTFVINRDR